MDAATSAAAAAWVAGIAAVLFGVSGLIVGVMGYRKASQAASAAATSTLVAKEANQIAKAANGLAKESNRIAETASGLAAAIEGRSLEQSDVRWKGRWVAPGLFRLAHVGMHPAHQVVVQVRASGETAVIDAGIVDAGQHVDVELEQIKPLHMAAEFEYAGHRGLGGGQSKAFGGPGANTVVVRAFWNTPLGVPAQFSETSVIYFDPSEPRQEANESPAGSQASAL